MESGRAGLVGGTDWEGFQAHDKDHLYRLVLRERDKDSLPSL